MRNWQCHACGYLFDEPDPVRTVKGVRFAQPGDCAPDEYTNACPRCKSLVIGNPTRETVTT